MPVREKLFGPVIVYETAFRVEPDASCSDSPIEPSSDFDTDSESLEHPDVSVAMEPSVNTIAALKTPLDTRGARATRIPWRARARQHSRRQDHW